MAISCTCFAGFQPNLGHMFMKSKCWFSSSWCCWLIDCGTLHTLSLGYNAPKWVTGVIFNLFGNKISYTYIKMSKIMTNISLHSVACSDFNCPFRQSTSNFWLPKRIFYCPGQSDRLFTAAWNIKRGTSINLRHLVQYGEKVYFMSQILVHKYWTILGHFGVPELFASESHQHVLKNVNITFSGNTGTPEMLQYSPILGRFSIWNLKYTFSQYEQYIFT